MMMDGLDDFNFGIASSSSGAKAKPKPKGKAKPTTKKKGFKGGCSIWNFIFPLMMIVIMIVFFAPHQIKPNAKGKACPKLVSQPHLKKPAAAPRATRAASSAKVKEDDEALPWHDERLKDAAAQIPSRVDMPFEDLLPLYRGEVKTPDGKRCDLWEVFSIPRLGPVIRKMGGQSLRSYDLAHYWDLSEDRYMRLMIQDFGLLKPKFIFLSPPCRYLSPLMHSNWPRMRNYQKKIMSLTEGLHHLDLSMWVAGFQISQGALFALEHPDASLAWSRKSVTLLCFVFYFVTLRYHVFWCWFGKIQSLNFWIISIISMKKSWSFWDPTIRVALFRAVSCLIQGDENPGASWLLFGAIRSMHVWAEKPQRNSHEKENQNSHKLQSISNFGSTILRSVASTCSDSGVGERSEAIPNLPKTIPIPLLQPYANSLWQQFPRRIDLWNWHAGQRVLGTDMLVKGRENRPLSSMMRLQVWTQPLTTVTKSVHVN